ncbi:MAG: hypothetical protein CVU88_07755 [Firmicutes bacterium HGW-Firmicutes-13]|nr:MAG: hypothetical protein CVU88_07755 [Firmicutes bacterium HGW-Firmicutes-13]
MSAWVEILLRSTGLFFLVIFLVRIIGKRNPARMTPFRFVIYVVIGVLTSLTAAGVILDFISGLVSLASFVLLLIVIDYLSLRSKAVHGLVNGKEAVLIKQGKIMEENLNQVRLTGEELLRELRYKDVFNLADVEFAVMEATGDISVMLKSDKKPVTPHDMGRKVSPQSETQTVILDGNVLNEPLNEMGLNQHWLKEQLENAGVSPANVFIGQVDSSGELYLDLFDDSVQLPQPKVKEKLYAGIEKVQADLMTFSVETEEQEAKDMFSGNADKLKNLLEKLEPYLLH